MGLDEECQEVIDKTEWIAITTSSESGPHTVAAWGYRLRRLGIQQGGYYSSCREGLWSGKERILFLWIV